MPNQNPAIDISDTTFTAENQTDAAFLDFQKAVQDARPGLAFTFSRGPGFEARWTFPGARFGGSVMWTFGSRDLSWGIAEVDLDAWREFENSCGREPRWS